MTTCRAARSTLRWRRRALAASATASVLATALLVPTAAPATAATSPVGTGTTWGDSLFDDVSRSALSGRYDDSRDPGSLSTTTSVIGARDAWKSQDSKGRAITGQGVTVAVLDSGVAAVPGLTRVVQGPDLSIEANSPTTLSTDSYGHGTHMAGIIGASDAQTLSNGTPVIRSGDQLGVAPGAGLLALKLANTDGSTDVSQVIAGIDWVVEHRNDNGMNVRVINLSYGTDSTQDYRTDPLAAAVERAWQAGIVVVVSGGNTGKNAGTLTDPAVDPYVIAVGASSPDRSRIGRLVGSVANGQLPWGNPSTADFSARGTAARHVDVVAPGTSVTSLRAPGSNVDTTHPEGRVANDASNRLFRGSGTSQAAAVVSGTAALLLQANPGLTPDGLKAALMATADRVPGASAVDAGAGQIDVTAALQVVRKAAAGDRSAKTTVSSKQTWPVSSGLGSLERARGSAHLVDPASGRVLSGEVDVRGSAWSGQARKDAASRGATWSGGSYLGTPWTGSGWTTSGWQRSRWSDEVWQRSRWSGAGWEASQWSRSRWSSDNYSASRWS
ncbi:S8 family serine peptidase [Quadrisphaera sp. INWT6]|nr:S8 family serine peptidase [Quadrisphaera sp. INWT6]